VTIWAGIIIFLVGVIGVIRTFTGTEDVNIRAPLITTFIGALSTIGGFLGTYVWEPAKGLNKVASELSRLIMSFENYLGRMRLIGLGFAHAYTQNNFEQLLFLSRISEITADAMRESTISLKDIGKYPNFVDKRVVTVPVLIDNSLESARGLVEQTKLEMIIGDPEYSEDKNPGTIIAQDPPAGVYVAIGSKIKVSPSTNQRPVVKVPDFTGKTILEAVESVQDGGIELGYFQFQFDVDAEEGTIITQDLRTGLNVSQGTAINLTIAKRMESSEEI
jgi:hypothetical protein